MDIVKEIAVSPPKQPRLNAHRRSKTWEPKSPRPKPGAGGPRGSLTEGLQTSGTSGSYSHPKKDREAFRSALVNIIMYACYKFLVSNL